MSGEERIGCCEEKKEKKKKRMYPVSEKCKQQHCYQGGGTESERSSMTK